MLNYDLVLLQSLLSLNINTDPNKISMLQAHALGQAGVTAEADLADGRLQINDTKLSFADLGANVEFGFTYTNQCSSQPWLLRASRSIKTIDTEKQITVIEADGSEQVYQYNNGQYEFSDKDGLRTLTYDQASSSYIWNHSGNQITEIISAYNKQVNKRTDAQGFVTEYQYEGNKLKSIKAPSEIIYEFTYQDNEIIVSRVQNDAETILHRYFLNADGSLSKSVTADGYETNYQYENSKLTCVSQSDKSEYHFGYHETATCRDYLSFIRMGDKAEDLITLNYNNEKTDIILPSQDKFTVTFNNKLQPEKINLPGSEYTYIYNDARQIDTICYPDKSEEHFEYHPKYGLITKHTLRDGSIDLYDYTESGNPVIVQHIRYSAAQASYLLTERYVYEEHANKCKLIRFEISHTGSVREYKYDDKGLVIRICQYLNDRFTPDNVPNLEQILEWQKALEKPQTHITDIEYEDDGQVKRQCTYSQILENGKGDKTKPYHEKNYSYDERGNLRSSAVRTGYDNNAFIKSRSEFDNLKRIKALIEGMDTTVTQITKHAYKENEVTITAPNAQSEVQTTNASGLLIKDCTLMETDQQTQLHMSKITRNYQTKVNVTANSDMTLEYDFVDSKNRSVGRVGKTGQPVKIEYDDVGRYRKTTAFATKFDTNAVNLKEGWVEPPANDKDRTTYTFYGFNNEIRYELDGDGYLKEYRYHLNGKPTHVIAYSSKVTQDELASLKQGLSITRTPDRKLDRVTSKFYDANGKLQAEQDGAGYIVEIVSDAGGRPSKKITYDDPVLTFTDSFSDIKNTSAKNGEHYYFYNNLNQCELEVDALGNVISREFELDGKVKSETSHYNKIDLVSWLNKSERPAYTTSGKDQTTSYVYDELRRLQVVKKANGEVITYAYDEMNHQISLAHTDGKQPASFNGDCYRNKLVRYNKMGQITSALNELAAKKIAEIDHTLSADEIARKTEEIWQKFAEHYQYNIHGLKVRTIDALQKVTIHYYDRDRHPVMSIDATGAVIECTYNAFDEVETETHRITRIDPAKLKDLTGGFITDSVKNLVTIDEDHDRLIEKEWNNRGLLELHTDSKTRRKKLHYNAFNEVDFEMLAADTDKYIGLAYEYEGRGLIIKKTKFAKGEKDIVETAEYKHHSGLKTASNDADGGRLEFVRNFAGLVTAEKVLNESGEMQEVKSTKYDVFSRPYEITDADKQINTVEYDDSSRTEITTLADGVSKKKVTRNAFNEVIRTQVTDKDANVIFDSQQTHAADGQVDTLTDGVGNQLHHLFNILGLEETTILQNKSQIGFEYNDAHVVNKVTKDKGQLNITNSFGIDALHRQETITDGLNHNTKQEFTPQGECTRVERDMGTDKPALVTQSKLDALGNIKSLSKGDKKKEIQMTTEQQRDGYNRVKAEVTDPDGLALTKQFGFDNADRITKIVDAEGHISRNYFNKQGLLRFELKPVTKSFSCLVEHRYSTGGRLLERRVHRLPIAVSDITDTTTLDDLKQRYPGDKQDKIKRYFYENGGTKRTTIKIVYDEAQQTYQAAIKVKVFDAAGRLTKKQKYATLVLLQDINSLDQVPSVTASPNDRVTYRYYDKASNCRFEVDQDGYVTEKIYDAMGKVITTKEYEDSVADPANFKETDIPAGAPCRIKHAIFDTVGREIFSVNSNGLLVRKDYDANDNLILLCRFDQSIDPALPYESIVAQAKQRVINPAVDSVIKREHDYANRLKQATDEEGYFDLYDLNALNSIETHTDRNGKEHVSEYDAAQRKIRQWSPETLVAIVSDVDGKLVHEEKRMKVAKKYERDNNGNIRKLISGEGLGESIERVVEMEHAASGTLLSSTARNVEVANDAIDINADGTVTEDIFSQTVVNEQGLKIAERNKDGIWNYYIRDAFGKVLFSIINECMVTQHHYNAFALEDETIQFNTPFTCDDWLVYRDPAHQLTALKSLANYPRTDEDRVVKNEYYPSGKLKQQTFSKIAYYDDETFSSAEPVKQLKYNRFGELVYEANMLSPGKWAEKAIWRDAAGRPVLEIDENRYVTRYERDVKGNVTTQIEYAEALAGTAELLNVYNQPLATVLEKVNKDSKLNRIYILEYDKRGDKVCEKLLEVQTSDITIDNNKIPHMIKAMQASIGKRFVISPTQKCLRVEMETEDKTKNVVLEEYLYDERDIQVAQLETTRTRDNFDDTPTQQITPLTLQIPNVHGEIAVKQTSPMGCVRDEKNIPFFPKDVKVYEEIAAHDKRGKENKSQNKNGVRTRKTYTRSGKLAAKTIDKDMFVSNAPKTLDTINIKTTEKLKYSSCGQVSEQYHIADGIIKQSLFSAFNIFGEHIGSGQEKDKFPEFKKRDTSGRVWMDNSEEGAAKYRLRDLMGNITSTLSADEIDLSTKTLADVPALLKADRATVHLANFGRDKKGGLVSYKDPSYYRYKGLTLPTFSQKTDRWHNTTERSDSRGNTTNIKIDKRNNVRSVKKPETQVRNPDGTRIRMRPKTKHGYNIRNGEIGKVDARGHCEAYVLDEANQMITRILADGVLDKRFTYDALGRIEIAFNSSHGRYTYFYDGEDNVIEVHLPKSGVVRYQYDQRNNRIFILTADGKKHYMNYSIAGDVVEHFSHFFALTKRVWNHRHQLISEDNPDGTKRSSTLDFFGVAENHTDLTERFTKYQRNFNRKLKQATTSNNPDIKFAEVTYGHILLDQAMRPMTANISDKANVVSDIFYKNEYGQLIEVDDITSKRREVLGYDTDMRRASYKLFQTDDQLQLRDINQTYNELGNKDTIIDANCIVNGLLTPVTIAYEHDADENVLARQIAATSPKYNAACSDVVNSGEWVNSVDAVGRASVCNGKLDNGVTKHDTGRGISLLYEASSGTRKYELYDETISTHRRADIYRDEERRIYQLHLNNGLDEFREYTLGSAFKNHVFKTDQKVMNKDRRNLTTFANDLTTDTQTMKVYDNQLAKDNGLPDFHWTTTLLKNSPSGYTILDETTINYPNLRTDLTSDITLFGKESLSDSSIASIVVNKNGQNVGKVEFGFNANLDVSHKKGWDDNRKINNIADALDDILSDRFSIFDRTSDGKMLNQWLFAYEGWPFRRHTQVKGVVAPILDVHLNPEGYYRAMLDEKIAASALSRQGDTANNPDVHTVPVGCHVPFSGYVQREGVYNFSDEPSDDPAYKYTTATPSSVPTEIVVQSGDTLEGIAYSYFGDARYAEDIALHNGLMSASDKKLRQGSILLLPFISPDKIKQDMAMPYYQFANKVIGSLSPNVGIPLPKVHHPNFFAQFAKMLALAIVVIYAPALAKFLIPSLVGAGAFAGAAAGATAGAGAAAGATAATSMITMQGFNLFAASAVIAGIGDAAIQGVAIGVGAQERFNSAEMIESGVSAGMASGGISALALSGELDYGAQALNAVKVASAQVATQLAEMSIGARSKFDAPAVGEQVLATLIGAQIAGRIEKPEMNATTNQSISRRVGSKILSTASSAVIGSVANHTPISVQQVAVDAIGGLASDEASSHLNRQMEQSSFVDDDIAPERMTIPAPGLVIPGPAYGEVSYQMGVLNQQRMAYDSSVLGHITNGITSTASSIAGAVDNTLNNIRLYRFGSKEASAAAGKELYETGIGVAKEIAVDAAIGVVTAGVGGLVLKGGLKAAPYLGRFGLYAVNGAKKAIGFEKAERVESEIAASANTAGTGLKSSTDSLVGVESPETLATRALNRVRVKQNEIPATNLNTAEALATKYRALENAQNKAVTRETWSDGRIRYYKKEVPSSKPGPTRGTSYVTEYNANTGDVHTWMESYDHLGNVNRIHPKMYNGEGLSAPHYPPTLKDKLESEYYSGYRR